MKRRHMGYFVGLAEQIEPDAWNGDLIRCRRALNDEQDNLLIALERSANGDLALDGIRLIAALGYYWYLEGRHSMMISWTLRALQHQETLPGALHSRLLLLAGMGDSVLNNMDRARQLLLQALDLSRKSSDTTLLIRIFIQLAYTTMGDSEMLAQAKNWLDNALTLSRQNHDISLEASALNTFGEIVRATGDYAAAKKVYEDCLSLAHKAGDRWRELMMLSNFSFIYAHEGDYCRAYDFARQTMQLALELNSVYVTSDTFHMLAGSIAQLGQPEKAARLYGVAEAAFERLGAHVQAADLADYEHGLVAARALVDPVQFEALWAEGRSMKLEQAIEYALSDIPKILAN
jgi:Tfp pilus assembly protein PilF